MKTNYTKGTLGFLLAFLFVSMSMMVSAQKVQKQMANNTSGHLMVPTELSPSTHIPDYENKKAKGLNVNLADQGKSGKTNNELNNDFSRFNVLQNLAGNEVSNTSQRSSGCFIPVDASFTAVPRNDDGSFGPINLGFTFNLYGTNYTQAYINTNGNITFTGAVYAYSSTGFPFGTPMVAPFWGDVDTRNGGQIYYKLTASHLIVTWNGVRYYPSNAAPVNTFQAIIGTNADALTGVGQNVSLRYADMQWTTGNASSGSGGFGGIPATVGINKGNSVNYVQIGRFNQNNSSYDGPGGSFDGVHYLDNQCVAFNASNASNIPPSITGLPSNNVLNMSCGQTANLNLTAIAPEVNQSVSVSVNLNGMCNTTSSVNGGNVQLSIGASPCNAGSNTITITATDNGTPARTTTQSITVNVANCCAIAISATGSDASCVNANDGGAQVTQNGGVAPVVYTWSNGHTTQNLNGVGIGTYSVTATDANGCTDDATVTIGYSDNITPNAVAQNVTVQLDASGNGSTTAALVDNGSSDACGIASMTIDNGSFTCANVGSNNPVTLTVTDVNGNVSTASAMVTVVDAIAPVAVAQNVTVQLDASGNGSTTAASVNNGSSDACGIASMTIDNASFTCANVGSNNPVTLTVTDVNGNSSTASAMVRVVDNVNPVAVAQNVTVQLDASGNGSTTAALVNNGSSDACGIASMSIDNASFTCANVGSNNPVTLTVTDVNGNVSTASAMVTVEDNVNPLAIAQGMTVQLDVNESASITAGDIDNGSSDACGIASMTLDQSNFDCSHVGSNSVTLTVTDNNGNSSASSVIVLVEDNVAPMAICQAVTVTLANGSASVTPAMVDNGSNDACGIASMTLSEDTWTCGDIGDHTVTLTVTDNNGNVSSCDAVVSVVGQIPTCSIASLPSNNTYTGGVSTTLYLGYGAQSTTLSCTATGGNSFTYAWTGTGLSSTTSANPVFTPTAEGIYNFSVVVTNDNGCETSCSITICVRDIRVYKKGKVQKNKVYLCHAPPGNPNNTQTLSISVNAVGSHLSNHAGDALGICGASCGDLSIASKTGPTGEMYSEEFNGQDVDVILYPNPSTDFFSVMVESDLDDLITVELYDMAGNLVERVNGQLTYHQIEMGRDLASGMYMVVVTQGEYRKVIKASRTK